LHYLVATPPQLHSSKLCSEPADAARSDRRIRYTPGVIPFLHLGPIVIPTYGLMVATGMIVAYFVMLADFQRRGILADAESFIALPCLAGIIGAKIYFVLETPREFFAHPLGMLFDRYGLTWTGGLIGGAVVLVLLARRAKIPLLAILDAASPAGAIGYGFGRMGCLLSGDGDYGVPTSLPWGMSFPNGLVPTTEKVHPTPIYEFLGACLIAWMLWRAGAKQAAASSEKPGGKTKTASAPPSGSIFALYLLLTGVARFFVEFIRINPRVLWALTNAQIVSLACILAGAVLSLKTRRKAEDA
jgi:phosphatidylglycerol---prolipoprotein diacylglyceryl transferase